MKNNNHRCIGQIRMKFNFSTSKFNEIKLKFKKKFQQNGELRRHRQLRIGWFDQHSNEALNGEQTAADYLCTKFNIDLQVFIFLLFITTDISVTLWILNQNKKGGKFQGRILRNREHEILFMDLRQWRENSVKGESKKKVRLDERQIDHAVNIYHIFAGFP